MMLAVFHGRSNQNLTAKLSAMIAEDPRGHPDAS